MLKFSLLHVALPLKHLKNNAVRERNAKIIFIMTKNPIYILHTTKNLIIKKSNLFLYCFNSKPGDLFFPLYSVVVLSTKQLDNQ